MPGGVRYPAWGVTHPGSCAVDDFAFDQRVFDLATHFAAVEWRVLALAFKGLRRDHPVIIKVDQRQVGAATGAQAGFKAEHGGRRAGDAAECQRQRHFVLFGQARVSGSSNSSPVAPASASANGTSLASSSTGVWSEQMASMVPSSKAVWMASRSRTLRSGGSKRNRLSK